MTSTPPSGISTFMTGSAVRGPCPASFRCLTRFGNQIDDKVREAFPTGFRACWINPGAQPQAAAATPPAPAPLPPAVGASGFAGPRSGGSDEIGSPAKKRRPFT